MDPGAEPRQRADHVRPRRVPRPVSGEAGGPGGLAPSPVGRACRPGVVTCSHAQCLAESVTEARVDRRERARRQSARPRTAATRSR